MSKGIALTAIYLMFFSSPPQPDVPPTSSKSGATDEHPGLAMLPFLLPSSAEPNGSSTARDASSSQLTLFIMLIALVIFLPVVLAYTAWVYRALRGNITPQMFEINRQAY